MYRYAKIRGLGCVTRALARARDSRNLAHIFSCISVTGEDQEQRRKYNKGRTLKSSGLPRDFRIRLKYVRRDSREDERDFAEKKYT